MNKPSASQMRYWEAKLKRYGLDMGAGRVNWITYGHQVLDLDFDGRNASIPKDTGESSENTLGATA